MKSYSSVDGKENASVGGNLRARDLRRISSESLLIDSPRVLIEHGEMEYFLSITRQGKLILTK